MSDQPTLYRANPSPIEGEEDAIERLAAFRAIVPVEPVGEAIVWGHRPWELVITDPPYQQLPPGEYLIVPKEADDE